MISRIYAAIIFASCLISSLVLAAGEAPLPWNPRPAARFREIWPVDKSVEATLLDEVGTHYTTFHTGHFAVTHASQIETAKFRGELLESVYSSFTLFFDSHGFDLMIPPALLQTIFFRTREEFILHLAIPNLSNEVSGLYRSDLSRGYFFDTLGRHESRETNKEISVRKRELTAMQRRVQRADDDQEFTWKVAGRAGRRVSKEEASRLINKELRSFGNRANRFRGSLGQSSLETMCHEAAHQLSHRMGVVRLGRATPLWLSEGLATFFEPSRNGYLLPTGSIHWRRLDLLNRFHAKGRRIQLSNLLTQDELFHDPAAATLAYHEAWSLFHYLATERPGELMRYLRDLRPADPKGSPKTRIQIFESAFGSNTERVEALWQAHVDRLARPDLEPTLR